MQYIRLLLFYSVIFQSVIFQSCKFHPRLKFHPRFLMVRHFPLLQIPVTHFKLLRIIGQVFALDGAYLSFNTASG